MKRYIGREPILSGTLPYADNYPNIRHIRMIYSQSSELHRNCMIAKWNSMSEEEQYIRVSQAVPNIHEYPQCLHNLIMVTTSYDIINMDKIKHNADQHKKRASMHDTYVRLSAIASIGSLFSIAFVGMNKSALIFSIISTVIGLVSLSNKRYHKCAADKYNNFYAKLKVNNI